MSDTTRTAPEGAETLAPEPVEKSPDGSEAESDLIVATLAEETDDDVSIRPFQFRGVRGGPRRPPPADPDDAMARPRNRR